MSNTTELSKEKLAILRKAVHKDVINCCYYLDRNYVANFHHDVIATALQRAYENVQAGIKTRIIIEVPPRYGKSELASIKFPAWVLGKNPALPMIITSYSADLAVGFGSKARDIVNSERYQAVFNTRLKEDSKAKNKWNTEEGGGYNAVGIGGSVTGKGFKIGIIDDPFKNREEADSEVIREKVWDWYTSTFYTRQEGETAIIIINTRWNKDDLVGRLLEAQKQAEEAGLEKGTYDEWEVIKFPAIAEEDDEYRKAGDPLWPEKFSLQNLLNTKNTIGVYDWSSLYQQEPINAETQEFKEEYFTYFYEEALTGDDVKDKHDFEIDITVDPAISEKKKACNTAIAAVGKFKTRPDWYILDYVRAKLDPGKLVDATFMMAKDMRRMYPRATIRVHIETVAYQKSIMYYLKERMKKEEEYFDIYEFSDTGDKVSRIRGLIPLFKTQILHHRRHMKELEKEALEFPSGKLVDLLDAISFNLQIKKTTKKASNINKPRTPYVAPSPFGG